MNHNLSLRVTGTVCYCKIQEKLFYEIKKFVKMTSSFNL